MATHNPAKAKAENQQQGSTDALPQQTGNNTAPQEQQQHEQQTPIFRDFASI